MATLQAEAAKLNGQIAKEQAVQSDISRIREEWLSMAKRLGPLGDGDSETAVRRDTEWLTYDPEYPAALISRSLACAIGLNQYRQAKQDVAAVLRQFPNSAEALAISAFVDARQGNYASARSQFQKARIRKQNQSLVFTLNGRYWAESGNWSRARADLKQALKHDAKNVLAQIWMTDLCATSPDDTIRDGSEALAYGSDLNAALLQTRWDAILALASTHAELGDFAKAVSAGSMALKRCPAHERARCTSRLNRFRSGQPWRAE